MKEIICILDGSGSMGMVAEEAVNGFNEFLEQQKHHDANITIVWFDNGYKIAYEGHIKNMEPLQSWSVGGMTALYDAIGKTFKHVEKRFSIEKPEKVVLAIQTDGEENSSKQFELEEVKTLIAHHENKYNWTVIYLGAGLHARQQAVDMGIQMCNATTYHARNTRGAFAATGQSVSAALGDD